MLFQKKFWFVIPALIFISGIFIVCGNAAMKIDPGDLDHFILRIPDKAAAGENFLLKLEVRDAYDNVIVDYNKKGKPIKLSTAGDKKITPETINPSDFFQGTAQVLGKYEKAGDLNIIAKEEESGKSVSGKMIIGPSIVDKFSVAVPLRVTAGKKFNLEVKAVDVFGNLVTDYDLKHSGIEIVIPGIFRKIVPASAFNQGIASVEMSYEKTCTMTLSINDLTENAKGKSGDVIIEPSDPDRFVLVLPDKAVAGKPFQVKIKVYDIYGNLVTNYDRVGKGVLLNPKGNGKITPEEVAASSFVDGVASVNLTYDKAEIINPEVAEKSGKMAETPKESLKVEEKPVVSAPVAKEEPKVEKKPDVKTVEQPSVTQKPKVEPKSEKTIENKAKSAATGDSKIEAQKSYDVAVQYIGQRKYKEAQAELEKCISLDPDNIDAKKLLSRVNMIIKLGPK